MGLWVSQASSNLLMQGRAASSAQLLAPLEKPLFSVLDAGQYRKTSGMDGMGQDHTRTVFIVAVAGRAGQLNELRTFSIFALFLPLAFQIAEQAEMGKCKLFV